SYRRLRAAALALAGSLLAVVGIAIFAGYERNKEVEARKEAIINNYFNSLRLARSLWENNDVDQAKRITKECPEGMRGWEWYYLDGLCRAYERSVEKAHEGGVNAIAFTVDGASLITAGQDGAIRVWDRATGTRHSDLASSNGSAVRTLAVTEDGRY